MKKLIAIIAALALLFTAAFAETEDKSRTITLSSNATTGYIWTAFVIGGSSVTVDSDNGIYIEDPNPEMMDGVGGKTQFTLTPVQAGESIVLFNYARPWEPEPDQTLVLLVSVDDDFNMFVMDVTEGGVLTGTVISVDEEDHSVLMNTERQGEIIARFDAEEPLPAADEVITIYTNGAMTMSLPAIVNVIAWASVPGEMAR